MMKVIQKTIGKRKGSQSQESLESQSLKKHQLVNQCLLVEGLSKLLLPREALVIAAVVEEAVAQNNHPRKQEDARKLFNLTFHPIQILIMNLCLKEISTMMILTQKK